MRLPAVKREDLSSDNQQRWDHIMAGRASGGGGPYSALIHAPVLADHLATAENYYRKDAALAEADRELVILATAREFEAHYPWTRHEIRARQAGLREDAIEAVRAHGSLEKLMPRERLFVEIVRSLLRGAKTPEENDDAAYPVHFPSAMAVVVGGGARQKRICTHPGPGESVTRH